MTFRHAGALVPHRRGICALLAVAAHLLSIRDARAQSADVDRKRERLEEASQASTRSRNEAKPGVGLPVRFEFAGVLRYGFAELHTGFGLRVGLTLLDSLYVGVSGTGYMGPSEPAENRMNAIVFGPQVGYEIPLARTVRLRSQVAVGSARTTRPSFDAGFPDVKRALCLESGFLLLTQFRALVLGVETTFVSASNVRDFVGGVHIGLATN